MDVKRVLKNGLFRIMASWLVTQYVRVAWVTSRWTVHGEQSHLEKWDAKEPFILAFWHGRTLMMSKSWRAGVPIHMLISQHRDGEFITRAVKPFGIDTIRGSTTKPGNGQEKGGTAALREILRSLKSGKCIGITPDGPRGPRMRASSGIVTIARLSGVPIIPVAWSARHRWELNSWDRFMIPMPFTQGVIVWGTSIVVPRNADETQLNEIRLKIEETMIELTSAADRMVGTQAVEPSPPSSN